jgi:hypothetical protein
MSPARSWFVHTGSRHTYKVKGAEIYVVAAEVKTIGDHKLIEHPVRILDPDTGIQVGETVKTDKEGVARAEVPKKKDYRIEIVDEEIHVDAPPPPAPDPPSATLVCEFVDDAGKPVAHEEVALKEGDLGGGAATTDEKGWLRAPARLGPVELTLRDQKFVAHSLSIEDAADPSNAYHFVLEKKS